MRALVDTNVLLAAAFLEASHHGVCHDFLHQTLAGNQPWCLSWVNVYEFLRVATHPRIFPRPMTFGEARKRVDTLLGHPALDVLAETPRHLAVLTEVAEAAGSVSGNFVHDCHIAALMREHDVSRIVTMDTHFRRFGLFEVVAP